MAQLRNVLLGRTMARFQRHLNNAIVHPNRCAVGKGQVINPLRQAYIVDDKFAVCGWDNIPDVVFHALEIFFSILDTRAGWSSDVKLDKAGIYEGEEVPSDIQR